MKIDLFSWDRFFADIPKLIKYFPMTLKIVLYAEIFGVALGVIIALLRIHKVKGVQRGFAVYVSFMRGTPMLVQMLLVYYGAPPIIYFITGIDIGNMSKLTFVVIAFVLNQGAFLSEIFRSAITAIPIGQTEAAYSVGLTKWQTFHRIILPQAARVAIPAFGNDLVGVFQNTSLAFLIGVMDIMGRAKTIGGGKNGHALEAYIIVMIVYVIMSLLIRFGFQLLDRKLLAHS
jgi:L-cystine transport system permease protein